MGEEENISAEEASNERATARPSEPQTLGRWRALVFDRLVTYTARVGVIAAALVFFQEANTGRWFTTPGLLVGVPLLVAAAYLKRLSRPLRAALFLVAMFGMFTGTLLAGGFWAPNIFVSAGMLAIVVGLSIGARFGWATIACFTLLLCATAWHFLEGGTPATDNRFELNRIGNWVRVIGTFIGASALGLLTVSFLERKLAQSKQHNIQLFEALQKESASRLETLKQQQEMTLRLQQATQLEALGRLAGGIAHDFNNLLTVIINNITLLREDHRQLEHNEDLKAVDEASERAAELANQLLTFGRQHLVEYEHADFDRTIKACVGLIERLIPSSIVVTLELGAPSCVVASGIRDLNQVVMNLCLNARDAMETGGTLKLSTLVVTRQKPGETMPRQFACFIAQDDGSGMDAETQRRLFEPFFTTKDTGKGTGLGLSVVHGVIEQRGGFITVESTAGEGTTFSMFLPISSHQANSNQPPSLPKARVSNETTLLVVDDDKSVLRVLTQLLRSAGFTVLASSNGTEALELHNKHQSEIQLLVTSAIMPGMGGRELYDKIHARDSQLPVLFCSGYASGTFAPEFFDREDRALLNKPFKSGSLLKAVHNLLEKRSQKPS